VQTLGRMEFLSRFNPEGVEQRSSGWCWGRSSGSASESISPSISAIDTDCGLESDSDSEVLCHPWISGTASTVTRCTDAESVG